MSTTDGSNGTGGGGAPGPGGGSGAGPGGGSQVSANTGVAAKITHVKTATLDAASGGLTLSGLTSGNLGSATGNAGTIVTSGGLSAVGAIKLGNSGAVATSITGTPIALNASQAASGTGAASIRAIGAGGQSTQVRVVMGNIMTPSMIKQLENAGPGRTQITAFPTAPVRSVSNTSITVTRSASQATYLPRANVTGTQMTGVGVNLPAGQRLVTPIRTTPASVSSSNAGATVTGITAAGNFVRGTAVSRSTSAPATTVISPATSTWMAANPTGQVQLIRAIPHQSRQRIITTQGISGAPISAASSIGGTVVTSTASNMIMAAHQQQTSGSQHASAIQAVSSAGSQQQQQTYVATVLPPRQHQATLVYSSNMATSQHLNAQQPSFHPSSVGGASGPRFAVATPLTATAGTTGGTRQIRPIPFAKSFSAAKLNTTSISLRPPSLPQLAPSLSSGVSASVAASNSPRSNAVTASTGNVIPSTTTRIIQLQQQPGGTTQQIIGSTGRLAANVMLQPIIVNASSAGKIGLRPPVTMAAKVQPSLTITQLGIGKLPSSSGGMQQNVNSSSGSASPSVSTATNLSTNVSQGVSTGQLIATQNMITSTAGTAAGGATVVPLAISTRSTGGGNILTGTMTPIKNASAITVGKVMTQSQLSNSMDNNSVQNSVNNNNATVTPTNVFIHHAPVTQRPHSNSSTSSNSGGIQTSISAVSNSGPNNVLTSSGNVTGPGTFLQPGSTIYYESVPASSVQVSTGVLSLTTTTVTSSTMSQSQMASTASNLSISSLPFVTHSVGNSTAAQYTVVPSTGGRTIGQLQIPVSNAGAQIQTVPVRFSQLSAGGGNSGSTANEGINVSQAGSHMLQQQSGGSMENSQLIIPSSTQGGQQSVVVSSAASQQQQQAHQMVIPLQTSIKVTSGGVGSTGTAVVSNFLRKRDMDGTPLRAAKNLQPTLLSMASTPPSRLQNSSPAPSMGSSYSLTSITSPGNSTVLTAESLARKDRAVNQLTSTPNNSALPSSRTSRADTPASSDGSTTVSANSSPGVEQQIQDNNMIINRLPGGGPSNIDSHFNPINELYSNHHSVLPQQNIMPGTPVTSKQVSAMDHHNVHGSIHQRLNGGVIDCPPRKKSRRSTNDSQHSAQSQASLSLPPPQSSSTVAANVINNPVSHESNTLPNVTSNGTVSNITGAVGHEVVNGKENAKPVVFVFKRPKNCTLMSTYKQSWKSANNHFQRYSDIKPREERRPTIMDLANQTNILSKINGWKIYHLKSQMEDLCQNESLGYEKLASMLKQMESHGITNEIERISDLLKGNMQRSKIIVDGINEAQNQIMKIFDHKSHVSDIINRCASKRNYKKRDKS